MRPIFTVKDPHPTLKLHNNSNNKMDIILCNQTDTNRNPYLGVGVAVLEGPNLYLKIIKYKTPLTKIG